MGLVSIGKDGVQNVCGHCGAEVYVKFEDMIIVPGEVTLPRCSDCGVAFDSYTAIPGEMFNVDAIDSDTKGRCVASQTLYKRAKGKAKLFGKFTSESIDADSRMTDLAHEDDNETVEPPLHPIIKGLRDKKNKEKEKKPK